MHSPFYRGRFAPSPTGPLHFGSLVAATCSYLDARASRGKWFVRIEDIDRSRCRPEYETAILRALERYGFAWDGEIMRQSLRRAVYREAFERLRDENRVYPCGCSRKEMADSAIAPDGAGIYPGTCASGLPDGKAVRGWRLKTGGKALCFTDLVQGDMRQDVARDVGDFIVFRADEGVTYQLAVVVDDAAQGISRIVRGADLLDSTPRQIALQQCLGISSPEYAHFPVVLDEAGNKLSKQNKARALDAGNPVRDLVDAFAFLGLAWADAIYASLDELWQNAIARWSLQLVPKVRTRPWVGA